MPPCRRCCHSSDSLLRKPAAGRGLHGAGNFAIMLLLYRPLRKALRAAKLQIGY